MPLTRLVVQNFRNIASADIKPDAGFNFLIGENGSGKSSLLEAIYTLGHGKAFRSSKNEYIIRHEQPSFTIYGQLINNCHEHNIGLSKDREGNTLIRIDGQNDRKIAELAQLFPIQLITPEGFTLLNGGPKYRRAFIDWGCFHAYPQFFPAWYNLRRILKQRNAALRQAKSYVDIRLWDKQLVPLAEQVSQYRATYVTNIQQNIINTCMDFLPEYHLTTSFSQGWEKERHYADVLEQYFERDRTLNYTAMGPHRADFRLRANSVAVDELLSRGQLKLLMCALRLAQGEYLNHRNGLSCLYLIDDFASELDSQRRTLLANRLKKTNAQVFVSAISADQMTDIIDDNGKIFQVKYGKIEV